MSGCGVGGPACVQAACQAEHRTERDPGDQDGEGVGGAAAVEEGGRSQQPAACSGGVSWPSLPDQPGSISGAVAVPESGLPMSIMATAPIPIPAYPSRDSRPRTVRDVAAMVRATAPALAG